MVFFKPVTQGVDKALPCTGDLGGGVERLVYL